MPKNRAKLKQEFYDRFSHSDASFFEHHIEDVWAPFLLEQPFSIRMKILGLDALAWMQLPPAPVRLSFPRRGYHCRIDRLGNYFARYSAVVQNVSADSIDRIPIHLGTSSPETLTQTQFTVQDENWKRIAVHVVSDEPHKKLVEIPVGAMPRGSTFSFYYYFRLSRAINYSGDIDFFDCRKTAFCEIVINSFYRLSGPQAFTMRSDRLIDRVNVTESRNANESYTYLISHDNRLEDDGVLFYFEGYVDDGSRMKFAYRTNQVVTCGDLTVEIRNIREDEITTISTLEREIEGKRRTCDAGGFDG